MKGCKSGYRESNRYCVRLCCPCLEESCASYGELTNADRVRAMSDDDLADFLAQTEIGFVAKAMEMVGLPCYTGREVQETAKKETLVWLQQPAQEDK